MPRYIIITDKTTELLDGTPQQLQERIKLIYERDGIVPIWSQTDQKPKRRYFYGKAR